MREYNHWPKGHFAFCVLRFEGVTELLPIHEKIKDGAEILWTTHRNRSVKSFQALIRTKEELPVFNDNEAP